MLKIQLAHDKRYASGVYFSDDKKGMMASVSHLFIVKINTKISISL